MPSAQGRRGFEHTSHGASAQPGLVAFSVNKGTTGHVELELLPFHGKETLWAVAVFLGELRELGAGIPETFSSSVAIQASHCGK